MKLDLTTASEFIYRETRMLDEGRFEEWLELFTRDAHYWMPAEWQQTDPLLQPSLMYEDWFLLKVRVQRLSAARTFSQKPRSRSCHVLQAPQIDEISEDAQSCHTWTPFHYTEIRGDDSTAFSGWLKHHLSIHDNTIKIQQKRVELLNFDAPLPAIQLFI